MIEWVLGFTLFVNIISMFIIAVSAHIHSLGISSPVLHNILFNPLTAIAREIGINPARLPSDGRHSK